MSAWWRARQRLLRAVQVIFQDLFGEGELEDAMGNDPLALTPRASILESLQSQMDALSPALDRLEARYKLSRIERDRLAGELASLDVRIDQALVERNNAQAHRLATQRMDLDRQHQELATRCQEQAKLCADAHGMIGRLQTRLNKARLQLSGLHDREQAAALLEGLLAARRNLEATLAKLESPWHQNGSSK